MTMLVEPAAAQSRPNAVVEPAFAAAGIVLGIDIGGTKTAAIVVDAEDKVLGRAERPTDRRSPVEAAAATGRAALAAAGVAAGALRAVGVAVPGDVDARSGTVRLAVNIDARDLPLGVLVGQELGAPCFVEHDARAAAIWLAARPGTTGDLAYLSIGTGISAGVVLDGQPLAGDNGLAGEIGHCVSDPEGPVCACGLRGCLEAIAAGPAVVRAAQAALDMGEPSVMRARVGGAPLTAADVYAAAEDGDPLALRVVAVAAAAIARAVRSLVLSYGVARVVIGGGPSRAGDAFTLPLMRCLDQERSASALLRRAFLETVEVLPPDVQPTSWGAIIVARLGLQRTDTIDSERRRDRPDER